MTQSTRKKERKKLGKMPKPWRYNSFSFFFFSSNDVPYIIQAIYTFIIHVIQYGRLLVYNATTTLHIFRLVVAIVWQPGLSTHFLPQRYLSYVSKFVVVVSSHSTRPLYCINLKCIAFCQPLNVAISLCIHFLIFLFYFHLFPIGKLSLLLFHYLSICMFLFFLERPMQFDTRNFNIEL